MPILGSLGGGSGKGFGITAGGPKYMVASGGTISEVGDYKIHTFTSPGTFTVEKTPDPALAEVDYVVIAGNGGTAPSTRGTAAGGFRESVPAPAAWTASPIANPGGSLPVSVQGYSITVGATATPQPSLNTPGNPGNPSTFSNITSAGGGGSGVGHYTQPVKGAPGQPGGCGGAAGGYPPGNSPGTGGTGNQPPVAPPQGQPGQGTATGWGGGAVSQYNGAGTAFFEGIADIGVPGTGTPGTPNLRYFSGGSGQGGSGDGSSPSGDNVNYGGQGKQGLVAIKYRFK